ncbi:MAG: hypothetical protein HY552_03560 [Elusimicrobia bacterium]|nr:hypothetical protein [Elusimicrobiota bacterium]
MKKEARVLLGKSVDSLILSIEHFNRPSELGRTETVLILLDHAFEMFLKAAIVHKGGRIRKPGENQVIGFGECVRRALSDGAIKFLDKSQAMTVQAINVLRDSAQHHIVSLSEDLLYLHAQSGLSLYKDLLKGVFNRDLSKEMPERVLPISTKPPTDIASLFQNEVQSIRDLLRPGARRRVEAFSRLRGLAILEGAVQGTNLQPTDGQLRKLGRRIQGGEAWTRIFQGVASLDLTAKGYGPSLDLRISQKEGVPVRIVPEGTPGAAVVAIRKVNELGFYNLSLTQLAEKLKLTGPRALALIMHLNLQADGECFKEIAIGKVKFKRYSQKALERMGKELPVISMEKVWAQYGPSLTKKKIKAATG